MKYFFQKYAKKILKQVEYESARRKRHINEKQEKEMRNAPHFLYVHLSRELKGSARRSNGRKKTQEKGQRGEISQMTGEEKRKHRSALRALKNAIKV